MGSSFIIGAFYYRTYFSIFSTLKGRFINSSLKWKFFIDAQCCKTSVLKSNQSSHPWWRLKDTCTALGCWKNLFRTGVAYVIPDPSPDLLNGAQREVTCCHGKRSHWVSRWGGGVGRWTKDIFSCQSGEWDTLFTITNIVQHLGMATEQHQTVSVCISLRRKNTRNNWVDRIGLLASERQRF